MSIGTILGIVAIVLVVLAVLNRQALANFFTAGRAQVGKVGRAALDADPVAVFQQQIEDAAHQLAGQLTALKGAEGQLESLRRQVADGEKEKVRLESRIKRALAEGDPNKTAQNYALQLAQVEKTLATNREQLTQQEQITTQYAHSVDLNRQKIREAQQKCQRMGLQLQQSEAQKKAAAQFAQLTNTDLFSGLGTVQDKIQSQIDANNASAKVDAQMSQDVLNQMKDDEDERKAEADEILARFKTPAASAGDTLS